MLAAYPGLHHECADYDEWVGLWLNIERIRLQRAADTWRGHAAALSTGKIPKAWFDALAAYPEQADELEYVTNMERLTAAARARRGW
jgi:hypothetical protein